MQIISLKMGDNYLKYHLGNKHSIYIYIIYALLTLVTCINDGDMTKSTLFYVWCKSIYIIIKMAEHNGGFLLSFICCFFHYWIIFKKYFSVKKLS